MRLATLRRDEMIIYLLRHKLGPKGIRLLTGWSLATIYRVMARQGPDRRQAMACRSPDRRKSWPALPM